MGYMIESLQRAVIPALVGAVMIGTTFYIVHNVKGSIETIAQTASQRAVESALAKTEPAITWRGVTNKTPKVKIGGVLQIEYQAVINAQCPSDLRAFLIDDNGGAVLRFPDSQGGYREVTTGEQITIPVSIKVMDPPVGSQFAQLAPGKYIYRVNAIRYCKMVQLDSFIPDVEFELVR